MDIVAALQRLGFAEYEARAYVALVKRSPLNGYELAKLSGVPRANIYGVLDRLTARRAILRLDEPGGARYAPVPAAEVMRRLGSEFQEVAETVSDALETLEAAPGDEPVWNVRGYAALLDQARVALANARHSLLLAVWPPEAAALRADVAKADERGVRVTTLCMAACRQECGSCRGDVYRYEVGTTSRNRRLVVVPDNADVVAGEIGADGDAFSIKTGQPLLVDMCSSSIRRSIALAAVIADLGARLDEILQPQTRAVLDAAAPDGDAAAFLDRMRALRVG